MVEAQNSSQGNKQQVLESIREADASYAEPGKYLGYGTAGFRAHSRFLERAFFRVGVIVAMRAKCVGLVGVMITASHNHHADNGVKIVEPDGSMLVPSWEPFIEKAVNATSEEFINILSNAYSESIADMISDDELFGVCPV